MMRGLSLAVHAQTSTDLRGIYVSGTDFPVSKQVASALSDALTVPGVDGLLLGIAWDSLEPGMNRYDWSMLDEWMSRAISLGTVATVQFAGLVSPGECQFNVVLPDSLANGDQPVTATYNGASTQAGTLISIQH